MNPSGRTGDNQCMRNMGWVWLGASFGVCTMGGCADPCFDDGLAQGGCPAQETEGPSTSTQTETETDAGGTMASSPSASDSASGETGTDGDPSAGTHSGGQRECPEVNEILLPQIPTVQLVVDQSGSMDQDFMGQSRWDAVVGTLVAGDEAVVSNLQSDVRFGLTLYTNDDSKGGCPLTSGLAPQLDASDEVTTALDAAGPLGDTPTGEALEVAAQTLAADPWEGDKVLVLATDGEPDTCQIPNPTTDEEQEMARSVARDAVTAAFEQGVRTFVISVGDEVAATHLQDLANAGIGNGPDDEDAPFYVALDQAELVSAFEEIIAGVRTCAIELPSALTEELAPSCTVTVNGEPVAYDDADGWALVSPMQIELQGTSCQQIQDGAIAIQMLCTCEEAS